MFFDLVLQTPLFPMLHRFQLFWKLGLSERGMQLLLLLLNPRHATNKWLSEPLLRERLHWAHLIHWIDSIVEMEHVLEELGLAQYHLGNPQQFELNKKVLRVNLRERIDRLFLDVS